MSPHSDDTQLWQLWRPFVGIHRWFFARGCPPTIRRLRGWTRIVHVTVLTATLGLLTGLCDIFSLGLIAQMDTELPIWGILGGMNGVLTLVPLSRWMGYSWRFAATSVIWHALFFSIIQPDFFRGADPWRHSTIFFDGPFFGWSLDLDIFMEAVQWGIIGGYWSGGIFIFMIDYRVPRTCWILTGTVAIGLITASLYIVAEQFLPTNILSDTLWGRSGFITSLSLVHDHYHPMVTIATLTALVAGSRLWSLQNTSHSMINELVEDRIDEQT